MSFTLLGTVLTASDAAASDAFGVAISLSADGAVLAVGASGWEGSATDQGGVYVYDRNGSSWTQRGTVLIASDAAASDRFGASVSLNADGSALIVGAYTRDGGATDKGGVYVYDRNGSGWTQRGTVLTASDAAASDYFGVATSLSADGAVLAVGALAWEGGATDQGGVYVYDRNGSGWTQRGTVLTASDAAGLDNFGRSVSLSADGAMLVVGAYTNKGKVYVYDRNSSGWTQRGTVLTSSDIAAGDQFGAAVNLSADGTVLAVGATGWEGNATDQGGVYVYDRNGSGWTQRGTVLTAPDSVASDYFGVTTCLSADGAMLVVGAYARDGGAADKGGVYVYTSKTISGTISESLAADFFIARAYEMNSGLLGGFKQFSTVDFTISGLGPDPYFVTVCPVYKMWTASTTYALNDKVFPVDPITTPYYYKRIAAGISGSTEPIWPTTPGGQCNDGTVTNAWELVERLIQPITHGPLIPS